MKDSHFPLEMAVLFLGRYNLNGKHDKLMVASLVS
jgi:hypothetical protein